MDNLEESHATFASNVSNHSAAPNSLFPDLEQSYASHFSKNTGTKLASSRPASAGGARNKTVQIRDFSSEKTAEFWRERFGATCPYFNALENVHIGPGGSGAGVGGSGIFRLPPAGKSATVSAGIKKSHRDAANIVGATGISHANRPASQKKARPWSSAGGRKVKLTLYDPDNNAGDMEVTNLKFRRVPDGQSRIKTRLEKDIKASQALQPQEPQNDDNGNYDGDTFEPDTAVTQQQQQQDEGPDDPFEKYFKMLKMGVPMGAVVNKCIADEGLNRPLVEGVLQAGPDAPRPKLPRPASNLSVISQLSDKLLSISDQFAEKTFKNGAELAKQEAEKRTNIGPMETIKLKDDPRYAIYFKRLKVGIPMPAIISAAVSDGVDAAEIEAVLLQGPEHTISVPQQVAKAATTQHDLSAAAKALEGLAMSGEAGEESDKVKPLNINAQAPPLARQGTYTPHSPLNLKSSMLTNALKKGQAKLRKNTITAMPPSGGTPAEETDTHPNEHKSLRRISSKGSMKDLKEREDDAKKEVSAKLIEGIVDFCTSRDKLLQSDEIIVASNATVFGMGRFGKVVKGMIRTKRVVKRRKESILDKHFNRSMKKLEIDVSADGESSSPPQTLSQHFEHQIEESVNMAVKIIQHTQTYMPVPLAKNTLHEIQSLERCKGECVVSLYGVAMLGPTISIVTPLYNQGNLYQLARTQQWKKIKPKTKMKLYYELAIGLSTIHSTLTVHADVKSHNMLVHWDKDHGTWSAAVGDLGSACFLESADDKLYKEQGTMGWTAPEVFTGDGYGLASDVFSFGIVLCDAVGNGVDQPGWPGSQDTYVERCEKGERPTLPASDGSGLQQIISFCWKFKEADRPSTSQIKERLGDIYDSM
jgi:serine/threonine protein kinase